MTQSPSAVPSNVTTLVMSGSSDFFSTSLAICSSSSANTIELPESDRM